MAGVETITQQILGDAQTKADSILQDAQSKAQADTASATRRAATLVRQAQARAEKQSQEYAARVQSQIGMQKRQRLLKARQDLIENVIDQAYQKLEALDSDQYFSILEKLVAKSAHAESGEILLNKRDLERMPASFTEHVAKIAKDKGGSLTLSQEAADIENGFVLRYKDESDMGGIDENCTIRALMNEKKERLTDTVNKVLWPSGKDE